MGGRKVTINPQTETFQEVTKALKHQRPESYIGTLNLTLETRPPKPWVHPSQTRKTIIRPYLTTPASTTSITAMSDFMFALLVRNIILNYS